MSKYLAWIVAGLLALTFVAAGCGDDEEEPAGGGDSAAENGGGQDGPVTLEPGQEFKSVFIPKQTGIAVFDQANDGAKEAAGELQVEDA